MKKMRRFLALALAVIMTLAMSVTAFADDTVTAPSSSDEATITVQNVESGATVTAYQIVKANYNSYGFTGYSAVTGVTLADVTAPTSDEITEIAQNVNGLTSKGMTYNATSGSYTAEVAPGIWMILVNGTVKVYNPMIASVYYSVSGSNNTMEERTVDANTKWTLETKDAYAKSTEPSIDKTITSEGGSEAANDNGGDVAVGDTVEYQIKTAIPDYSEQYTEVVVKISDTLSKGLTLNPVNSESKTVTVKVNGIEVKAAVDNTATENNEATYSITATNQGFAITFDSDYALANAGKEVVVTYSATVNDNAEVNFDPNTNTAKLEYSNNPADSSETHTTEDKTYTYTFTIGADISATLTEVNGKASEIIKVDEKGNIISTDETYTEEGKTTTVVGSGATFTLTNNSTKTAYTATTGADGRLTFSGLDAGTYTLVETKEPEGFTLDPTEHTVVIEATYNEDGTLNTYKITIDDTVTSEYKGVYDNGTLTNVTYENPVVITNIANTEISSLPSTGGIGTTIFTVAGIVIMVAAAGMFFASRKKKA